MENGDENPRFLYNPYVDSYVQNMNYIVQASEPEMVLNPSGSHPRMIANPFFAVCEQQQTEETEDDEHTFHRQHPPRERRGDRLKEPMKGGKSLPDPPNKPRGLKGSGSGSGSKCSNNVDWRRQSDPHYKG